MRTIYAALAIFMTIALLYSAPARAETKTVSFTVKSSVTHVVSGATISFNGDTKTTGIDGRTEFTGVPTDEAQDYSCSAPDYTSSTGQVSADSRVASVVLSKTSAPLFSGLLGLACLFSLISIALIIAYKRRM